MVTSNKLLDKKVVKMAEQNNSAIVPQRTLLGEVNEQITCPLCRGYYIDATTIVECLHSFCRSCIIKHLQTKSYCPVCEMLIVNKAKPNIKLDKALQDIVYKLVPGLFQKEMERRQQFYSSRPGPAASATPEQRGEDTERIIFSPEDVISFSLEYADNTDADSISSKSSDSNEPQPPTGTTRRFLQCPAVVNISHLKKFLSMKFDIDSTQFAIDILYKRVPLPDYYTLMDIAYIYNWKRNEPMRFFYQIIDYVAIRNRLFDINRKGSHFRDRKSSPTPTEDTNVSSPAPNLHDQGSEVSSGTDSPMPEENNGKKSHSSSTEKNNHDKSGSSSNSTSKKNDDEVEKSQFLNSFELTAKNNSASVKSSPVKGNGQETSTSSNDDTAKITKADDSLKRKPPTPPKAPEVKRLKIELEKTKIPQSVNKPVNASSVSSPSASDTLSKPGNVFDNLKTKNTDNNQSPQQPAKNTTSPSLIPTKEQKMPTISSKVGESAGIKRTVPVTANIASPKRKTTNDHVGPAQLASQPKTVSPLKLSVPKLDTPQFSVPKPAEVQKPPLKRMPDLKPTVPSTQASQNKGQPMNKVRMDFLANNSDPTIDRSKILSKVSSSLNAAHNAGQSSDHPLKSLLLDSCKINLPSSLSITLTDQKSDPRSPSEPQVNDPKKNITNKNLVSANSGTAHKVPSPPVHNYIEILKLPDSNPKKQQMKGDNNTDTKQVPQGKPEGSTPPPKPAGKSSESSAKGPVPNLKPIADTKLGKQSGNFASPITFQQTFEKQLQSLQSDKKTKLPKNKAQVPKLVPATPKTFNTMNKLNNPNNKSPSNVTMASENKPNAALDLTTPHNMQSQVGQHPNQSRLLEKMQSIANLAATKQNPPAKGLPANTSQGSVYSPISNRPVTAGSSPLRIPTSSVNQVKHDKISPSGSQTTPIRHDMTNKPFQMNQTNSGSSMLSTNYQNQSHNSPTVAQPSPRSQTRSPSSSPKLVIAEEKQATGSSSSELNMNQSNHISSTQLPNLNTLKNESPKISPGPSKSGPKPMKPLSSGLKLSGIRQPITPNIKSNSGINIPPDYLTTPQLLAQHPMMPHLRHQMEMNWYKANLFKSMANAVHQSQHDFSNKDKQ